MARHNKFNLQYFPLDVTFFDDHKVVQIEEEAGVQGGYIAIRLMAMVYADKGYFLEWPATFEFTAAKRIGNGVTGAIVLDLVEKCLKHGLFSRQIFETYGVLTSFGIQKRWLKIMKDCRRKVVITSELWLLSAEETGENVEEKPMPDAEGTQKEMKGNEIKKELGNTATEVATPANSFSDDLTGKNAAKGQDAGPKKKFIAPSQQDCIDYFLERQYNPAKAGGWEHGRCVMQATLFFLHYTANGWVQGQRAKPLKDWNAAAQKWIITEKNGTFSSFSTTNNSGSNGSNNVIRGTFQREKRNDDSGPEKELNYSFSRFLEKPEAFTIAQVETGYYNCLKQYGITFTDAQVAELRAMAIIEMAEKKLEATEPLTQAYMKKFAVIEYFKQMQAQGHKEIFTK